MNGTLLVLFGILLLVHILVRTYTNNKARHQSLATYFISSYVYAGLTFLIRAISFIMLANAYVLQQYWEMVKIGVIYASMVALGGMFIMWLQKREQKKYELSADMARRADAIIKERANKSTTKDIKRSKRGKKKKEVK